jgi:hypothetical protein
VAKILSHNQKESKVSIPLVGIQIHEFTTGQQKQQASLTVPSFSIMQQLDVIGYHHTTQQVL